MKYFADVRQRRPLLFIKVVELSDSGSLIPGCVCVINSQQICKGLALEKQKLRYFNFISRLTLRISCRPTLKLLVYPRFVWMTSW